MVLQAIKPEAETGNTRPGARMPYTQKQNKLFRAAAHDPKIAKSAGIPQGTAKKLAAEGVKPQPKQRKTGK